MSEQTTTDTDLSLMINVGVAKIKEFRRSPPVGGEWVGNNELRDNLDVYINEQALLAAMEDGRKRGSKIEAGGVFAGRRYINPATERECTELTNYIPLKNAQGSAARLTFTADSWSYATAKAEELGDPEIKVVCWFHTHPGYGVFLSDGYDQFINEHYFKDQGQLAIVFDPIEGRNGALGIFSAQGATEPAEIGGKSTRFGNFQLHRGFYVFKQPEPPERLEKAAQAEKLVKIVAEDLPPEITMGESYSVIDWKSIYGDGLSGHINRATDKGKQAFRAFKDALK